VKKGSQGCEQIGRTKQSKTARISKTVVIWLQVMQQIILLFYRNPTFLL